MATTPSSSTPRHHHHHSSTGHDLSLSSHHLTPQVMEDEPDPHQVPDLPTWRAEYSYRRQPYRYLGHQQGIIGYLKVRVVAARDLVKDSSDRQGRDISPQVIVRFLDQEQKTSVVEHNHQPTWRKEELGFDVGKGKLQEGAPVIITAECVDASVSLAMATLIGHKGAASLGHVCVDITSLLKGDDGMVVMDSWMELSDGGHLHLVLEYDPYGMTPQIEDIVFFEAFARHPRGLVLPIHEPLVVHAISGSYLHLTYRIQVNADTDLVPSSKQAPFQGFVKVHRNTVFVVERKTMLDEVFDSAMRPADMLLGTDLGKWASKQAKPYVHSARMLAGPLFMSAHVALGAARVAMRSAMAGAAEAANTAIGEDKSF